MLARHASCLSGSVQAACSPRTIALQCFMRFRPVLCGWYGLPELNGRLAGCVTYDYRILYGSSNCLRSLHPNPPNARYCPPAASGWARGRTSLNYQLSEMNQALDATVAAEELVGTQAPVAKPAPLPKDKDYVEEEVQKRIELRVSQSFFEAVKLLAETEGIARADVIRKAVSLYARARIEQKQGNCIAFARVGSDNNMEIVDMLSVI